MRRGSALVIGGALGYVQMMTARLCEYSNGPYTFDVIDSGPEDGIPVVLLHGFPQRAASWDKVSKILHDKGFRTYAPDQRGYSPRARPPRRRDYTTDLLIADLTALIDAIGAESVHLVGHDWGAAVAWAAAAKHPERVRSLTAVSVPHPAAFVEAMPRGQALRSWYMAFFNLPVLPEKLLSWAGDHPERSEKGGVHDATELREQIVEYGALPYALNWYRALPFTLRSQAGKVRVPTTYVWSDGDFALGRRGAELTAGYVDAPHEFRVIQDADHWLPDNRPDEVAAAVVEQVERVERDTVDG